MVIQKKLSIGASDDTYEIEADRIANQVVNMPDSHVQTKSQTSTLIQKKCASCEEQEEHIQKKPLVETITPIIQQSITNSRGETQIT